MKKINIGIIGCGHWGPNFVRNFNRIKDTSVKYACDLNPDRLSHIRELYPSVITIRDYTHILNDPDIDAAVIATPANTHYRLAKESLRHNKNVLVEKPVSLKINEARELIDTAKHNKKILMVGHTFKFNPGINKLRWLIQTQRLGKIFYIYSRRTNLGPLRKDVNAMWDLAPHDISIISYLLNSQPVDVTARGKKFLEHNLEDVIFMTLTYPRNVFVHVHVSWLDPRKVGEMIVVGSRKMAIFDDLDTRAPVKVYDKTVVRKHFRQDYDSFEEFQMIIKDGKKSIPRVHFKEPLTVECRHFVDCIKRNIMPLTDGKDGLNVLKVLIAIQKSLSNNGACISL